MRVPVTSDRCLRGAIVVLSAACLGSVACRCCWHGPRSPGSASHSLCSWMMEIAGVLQLLAARQELQQQYAGSCYAMRRSGLALALLLQSLCTAIFFSEWATLRSFLLVIELVVLIYTSRHLSFASYEPGDFVVHAGIGAGIAWACIALCFEAQAFAKDGSALSLTPLAVVRGLGAAAGLGVCKPDGYRRCPTSKTLSARCHDLLHWRTPCPALYLAAAAASTAAKGALATLALACEARPTKPFRQTLHNHEEIVEHEIPILDTAKFAAIVGIGPKFGYNSVQTLSVQCLIGRISWPPQVCQHGCAAIVDSGTSLIAAPASALMELGHLIGQIKEDCDCSNLHELPNLRFNLDGQELELPPQAYVMRVVGASVEADSIWDLLFFKPKIRKVDSCMPAFMEMDMNTQLGDKLFFVASKASDAAYRLHTTLPRAVSLMSSLARRCFQNRCTDPLEAVASGVLTPGQCADIQQWEVQIIETICNNFQQACNNESVYTGGPGVAYALLRAARSGHEGTLEQAQRFLEPWRGRIAKQASRHPDIACSLLCGRAGFLCVEAMLARTRGSATGSDACCQSFVCRQRLST
ncbi:unnamed protein product [Durusdinium trenchii]|uniref:Peptidase A1 domain-containing protein n=1 Tax=Durusdinium trenchii TaxID=1381693 RepID=A0ABP0J5S1_9DINO